MKPDKRIFGNTGFQKDTFVFLLEDCDSTFHDEIQELIIDNIDRNKNIMNPIKKSNQYQNRLLNRFNTSFSSKTDAGFSFRTITSSSEKDDTVNKYRSHINFLQLKLDDNKKVIETLEEQIKAHLNNQRKLFSNITTLQRQNSDLLQALSHAQDYAKEIESQLHGQYLNYSIKHLEDKVKQKSPRKSNHMRTSTHNPQSLSPVVVNKQKSYKVKTEEDTALTLFRSMPSLSIESNSYEFSYFADKNITALSGLVDQKDEKIAKLESAIHYINKKLQDCQKQNSKQNSGLANKISELQTEIKQKNTSLCDLEQKYGQQLSKNLQLMSDLQKQIQLIEKDKNEMEEQYKRQIYDMGLKQNSEGEAQAQKLQELQNLIQQKEQTQMQNNQKMEQMQRKHMGQIQQLSKQFNKTQQENQQLIQQLRKELSDKQNEILVLENKVLSFETQVNKKNTKIQQFQSKIKDVEKVRDQSRQKMIDFQSQLLESTKELQKLRQQRVEERKANKEIRKQLEQKQELIDLMTNQMQEIKNKFDAQKIDQQTQYENEENDKAEEEELTMEQLQVEFQRIMSEKMSQIQIANEGWQKDRAQLQEIQKQYNKICEQVSFQEQTLEAAKNKIEELSEILQKKDEEKKQSEEEINKLRQIVQDLEEKNVFYQEYVQKLKDSSVSN